MDKLKKGMKITDSGSQLTFIIEKIKESCSSNHHPRCSSCQGKIELKCIDNNKLYEPCISTVMSRMNDGYTKIITNSIRRLKL